MTSPEIPDVDDTMSVTSAGNHHQDGEPSRHLAIVTCMDARLDILSILGVGNGEAHVIRNAGGVVTDDVIRSLCLSQRALGTEHIILVHHTRCGVAGLDEAALKTDLEAEIGIKPPWSFEGFGDPVRDVVQSANRIRMSPFVPHTDHISGFVYDVETGLMEPVDLAQP